MTTGTGIDVSKAVVYVVVAPPALQVSKAQVYTVVGPGAPAIVPQPMLVIGN